jgi:hypothetical protein
MVAPDRLTYVVTLRAEPNCDDPVRALRAALKLLLRRFGLRCVSVEERKPAELDDYDAEKDAWGSVHEGYRAIRERVAKGGKAWEPK